MNKFARRLRDFRSDTVTLPTPAMKQAMIQAELGDDVYQEDPTINQLQSQVAKMFGKEAGLLVPSGTMGNLAAILVHCGRGDGLILGHLSHINYYEQGGMSSLGGIVPRVVHNHLDGTLDLDEVHDWILPEHPVFTNITAIALENTHNIRGGKVLTDAYMRSVADICKKHGFGLHLDGSRLLNAYIYLREKDPSLTLQSYVSSVDSLNLCFSKNLGAPIGSIILGTEKFIHAADRWRKALGGGMRQAGIIAAAALHALETYEEIITRDHQNAQIFAKGLIELGYEVDIPQTNIINFSPRTGTAAELSKKLKEKDILINARPNSNVLRIVTHRDVSEEDIDHTLTVMKHLN